ncbi:MAG: LemA family protein [Phycisphaerae bacterium]|nr:LemA family protein [Phycisphaerae bacterium]
MKRRYDLIPNLISVVKGLSDHERDVQTELASLRTQMEATPPGVAGPGSSRNPSWLPTISSEPLCRSTWRSSRFVVWIRTIWTD